MKKTNILYIALFISLFGTTSCDDFLDVKPVGKVIPESYQDFREVLTAAYAGVPDDRSLSTVRGDELKFGSPSWDGSHLNYKGIFLWDDVGSEGLREFPWQPFYKVILNANQVILNGEKPVGGKQDEIKQLQGEAYLLRAYMHLGLVNLYADVYDANNLNQKAIPIANTIDIWKNYKRNTIEEVYQQIETDIQQGIKLINIEEQEKGYNYRFSKISAYGFAARFYLYTQKWDKVREYAQKAYDINHSLENLNEADAILPTNYKSVENILAFEQTFHRDLGNFFFITDKLANAFEKENDLRFSKYFEKTGDNYKCLLGSKDAQKVSMRTAEFYLMLAEAEAKSGDLKKAKQYLNTLLSNRLTPEYHKTQMSKIDKMSKEEFVKEVENERFKELACQGFRWYDLKRFGKPELVKEFEEQTYTLQKNDARYIVKFPSEAVANNPNLLED